MLCTVPLLEFRVLDRIQYVEANWAPKRQELLLLLHLLGAYMAKGVTFC